LSSDGVDLLRRALEQICSTRQKSSDPAVGVFDAALLPRAVRIAEVGVDAECIAQFVVKSEFGAIVLG